MPSLFGIFSAIKDDAEDKLSSIDGSSILETANLMKQSVFMSPTFVSTAANEINELNIHNIVTESKESIPNDNEQFMANVVNGNHTDKIELNGDINPTYNATQTFEGFDEYLSMKEYEVENSDLILKNESYENCTSTPTIIDPSSNKISSVDDHADEAYLSDGSNSHSGTCSEITNDYLEFPLKQQKSSNQIKILSEQIINHSDLNTIQDLQIHKRSSSSFLIPVNTIVTGKATKDRLYNQLQQQTVQEELCSTPEIITKVNNKIGKVDVTKDKVVEDLLSSATHSESIVPVLGVNIAQVELCSTPKVNTKNGKVEATNDLEIDKNKDSTVVEDMLTVTHSKSIVPGVMKEETPNHKVKLNVYDDSKSEMVLDIDKYIHSYDHNNKTNYLRDVSKDLEVETINDTIKEIVTNTENTSSKSKLCIQGVEKPGGMHKNKTLKTYQRTNVRKRLPELAGFENTNVDSNLLSENVTDLDDINIHGYKNANKFCICSDFGQLENYDSDNVYEHIHFCEHNSVGCNIQTIFSMYDDTSICREYITEDVVNDVVNTTHYICWLSFLSENNDDTEEIAFIESTDASYSSPGQPRRSVGVLFYIIEQF